MRIKFDEIPPDLSIEENRQAWNALIALIAHSHAISQAKLPVDDYVISGLELSDLLETAGYTGPLLNWARRTLGFAES